MPQRNSDRIVLQRVECRRFQLFKRRVGFELRDAGVELGHRVVRHHITSVAGADRFLAACIGSGDAQDLAVAVELQRADAGSVLLAMPSV